MNNLLKRVSILLITLLFVVCVTMSLTVRSSSLQPLETQTPIDAAKLYDKHCDKCHGKDGRAKTVRGKMVGARNLTDEKWQESATDEKIAEAIKKGPDAMPAFEKKLSAAEIDALVAYVRHFKGTHTEKK